MPRRNRRPGSGLPSRRAKSAPGREAERAAPGSLVAGKAKLYAQGLREGCARFYWLARTVVGYNNSTWTTAVIIKRINWITKHYGIGDEGFRRFFKWLLGTHRIGQYEHMKPEYRHRLPAIEANYQEWAAKW
jgi:hypothetical protein